MYLAFLIKNSICLPTLEKTEAVTTLCRNIATNVKPIALRHLDGQLKSAWNGHCVGRFFQVDALNAIFQVVKVIPCGYEYGKSVILVPGEMIFLNPVKHLLYWFETGIYYQIWTIHGKHCNTFSIPGFRFWLFFLSIVIFVLLNSYEVESNT